MQKDRLAVILIISAAVMWATSGVAIRILSSFGLSAVQIVATRFAAGSVSLAVFIMLTDKSRFAIEKADLKRFFALGFFCVLLYNIAYTISCSINPLSTAVGLLYTFPIWTMIISMFVFKEKLTGKKILAITLNFLGICLLTGLLSRGQPMASALGIIVGLLAGFGFSVYGVSAKVLVDKYHALTISFYTLAIAGASGLVFAKPLNIIYIITDAPIVVLYIFIAAIVCFVLPYSIYTYSLNYIEASRASVIISIEPVMATVYGAVFFKETITAVVAAGIFLIVSAIIVLNINKKSY